MQFKDFEIRESKNTSNVVLADKYEIVKWNPDHKNCFVIGWLEYDKHTSWWDFQGCGLRYQEYYEEGLNEFVIEYSKLLDLQKKYKNKEMEELYENY